MAEVRACQATDSDATLGRRSFAPESDELFPWGSALDGLRLRGSAIEGVLTHGQQQACPAQKKVTGSVGGPLVHRAAR